MTTWDQGLALLYKGGIMIIPILFFSFLTISIGVERWLVYRKARSNGLKSWYEVKEHLLQGRMEEARRICQENESAIAAIMGKGFDYYKKEKLFILRDVLEGAVAAQVASLRLRMSYLSTIVTVAPLLGLLGTVVGMIQTFNVLAVASGQPNAVTGGVGEALISTAAGLVVAITAMLLHSYFSEWLETMISDMETVVNGIIESLGRD